MHNPFFVTLLYNETYVSIDERAPLPACSSGCLGVLVIPRCNYFQLIFSPLRTHLFYSC
jgi:hypothetical protein